jgi:signal transduction histidine kinase
MAAAADGTVQAADDLALRSSDGALRWADVRITRLPALTDAASEHPRQARFLCVFNDRTAHVEAERAQAVVEAAQHQRDVALATIQAKSQLLSRLSHELRTPLNAVLGFSQLLLSPEGGLSLQSIDRVQHIRRAGEHLLALVDEVLELNRAESNPVPPVREPVRLADVAQEVLALQQPAAALQSITLVLEHDSDPGASPTALADPRRVREVLINLVNNAIKYNVHHGWVTVRLGSDARHVWVEVNDGGIGMSDQQLDHLYEPFNRLGAERLSIEGNGLGLSIARTMVVGMSGQLSIRSRPGAGTCCRVSLLPAPRDA